MVTLTWQTIPLRYINGLLPLRPNHSSTNYHQLHLKKNNNNMPLCSQDPSLVSGERSKIQIPQISQLPGVYSESVAANRIEDKYKPPQSVSGDVGETQKRSLCPD